MSEGFNIVFNSDTSDLKEFNRELEKTVRQTEEANNNMERLRQSVNKAAKKRQASGESLFDYPDYTQGGIVGDIDVKGFGTKFKAIAKDLQQVGIAATELQDTLAKTFRGEYLKGLTNFEKTLSRLQGEIDGFNKVQARQVSKRILDVERLRESERKFLEIQKHKIKVSNDQEIATAKIITSNKAYSRSLGILEEKHKQALDYKRREAKATAELDILKNRENITSRRNLMIAEREIELRHKLTGIQAQLAASNSRLTEMATRNAAVLKTRLSLMEKEASLQARTTKQSQEKVSSIEQLQRTILKMEDTEKRRTDNLKRRLELEKEQKRQLLESTVRLKSYNDKIQEHIVRQETLLKIRKAHARLKNVENEKQLMREQAALKRLTTQERLSLEQKQRLAAAEAKNSAEYLRTEKAIARLESRYRRSTMAISKFNAVNQKGGIMVASFRNLMDAAGRHIAVYTTGMVGLAAAVYGTTRAVKAGFSAFNQYTEAMARVKAVSGASFEAMMELEAEARRLGRTTRFTAVEAAEGLVQLTMAGLTASEATAALEPTLQLASIGALQLGEAADIVTNILRGFALSVSELPHVVDVMATSVTSSNMTVQQLGNAMSYAAPVAQSFGISVEEVAASMEILHNSGIKASRAGTGLRRTLLSLYAPTNKGAEALVRMGVSTQDLMGRARPLIDILEDMNKSFANGTATVSDFKDIVGVRASNAFLQLIKGANGASTSFRDLVERLEDANGAADNMQDTIEDFIGADWQKLISALTDVGIGLLKIYETDIRAVIQGITKEIAAFAQSPEKIQRLASAVEDLASKLAFVGKVFLTYKLVQTFWMLGRNLYETMIYMEAFTARALGMIAPLKGLSVKIIEWFSGVQASATKTSVIVDASNKKIVTSTSTTASAVGLSMKGIAAGFTVAAKAAGRFLLSLGVFGAAIVAAGYVLEGLINWLFDTDDALGAASDAFDKFSNSTGEAKTALEGYAEAARMSAMGAPSESISKIAKEMEKLDEAGKKLSVMESEYVSLLNQRLQLENQIVELSFEGKSGDIALAEQKKKQLRELLILQEKLSNAMKEASTDKTSIEIRLLEMQVKATTQAIDKYQHTVDTLNTLIVTLGSSHEGITYPIEQAKKMIDTLKTSLASLLEKLGLLKEMNKKGEEGPLVGVNAIERANTLLKETEATMARVREGSTSAAAEVAQWLSALKAIASGTSSYTKEEMDKLFKEIETGFQTTFERAVADQKRATEAAEKLREKLSDAAVKARELLSAETASKDPEEQLASARERHARALSEVKKLLGEVDKAMRTGGNTAKKLTKDLDTQRKNLKKSLADEKAALAAIEKKRKDDNKALLTAISLGKEADGILKLNSEELATLAKSLDSSESAWGDYRVMQAKVNALLEEFPEYADAAAKKLKELRIEAEKAGKSDFEKTLWDWVDVMGDLDKASSQWLEGFAEQLANFIETGKADFSSFVKSILSDLAKLASRQIVIQIAGIFGMGPAASMAGAGSSLMGGGGFGGDILNSGLSMLGGTEIGGAILGGLSSIGSSLGLGSIGAAAGSAAEFAMFGTAPFSSLGAGGIASTGIMGALGSVMPFLGMALAALSAFGIFGDKEAESVFKILPGGKFDIPSKGEMKLTDFGSEIWRKGTRRVVNVDSPFGTMGARAQHIGKDEQVSEEDAQRYLDAMVMLFSKLAEIDKAIIAAYDLSDEAIARITEAANSMDIMAKKWGAPDLGKYTVERYKLVFTEIGGLAEKLFNDMAKAGMDAEAAIAAVTAAFQLDAVLEGLRTVGADAMQIISDMGMTQMERLAQQREGIYELADAYDGSTASANNLISALEAQRRGTIQLILVIEQIRTNMSNMFGGLREKILTDLMSEQEKFEYYKKQADYWMNVLSTATDPEVINEAIRKIDFYSGKAWEIQLAQGPEAAKAAQQEWLDYLDKSEGLADRQLDLAKEKVEKDAENLANKISETLMETVVPAMETAAGTIGDAGDSMNEAANTLFNAGGLMIEAAGDMKYAASQETKVSLDFSDFDSSPSAVGA